MRKKFILIFRIALIAALVLMLTGCFSTSTEELYSLPQLSEEYMQLQRLIDRVLVGNTENPAEYSAPTSGSHRQPVQFEDLDGDTDKEVVAFFSTPGDDMPLKIYLYELKEDEYYEAAIIEGSGTDIKSIDYADMDGDGRYEIIVGWQIASGVSMLSGYSINDYQVVQLFSIDYSSYTLCDMTESAGADVLVVGAAASDAQNVATLYSLVEEGEVVSSSAKLSEGVGAAASIKTGGLTDGGQGAFIESPIDETSIVTDVLAYKNGAFINTSIRAASGVSQGTIRTYSIYSTDIDSDGVMEVPNPVQLYSQSDTANYWLVEWYAFDSAGYKMLKETTYHNFSDSWYLTLPEDWDGKITARREAAVSGERTLIFSMVRSGGEVRDFLAIHTLSGTNREERATLSGRKIIAQRNNIIYVQEILVNEASFPLTINNDVVAEGFHILYSELST